MQFNIALIGASKVGKTVWLQRLITGDFINEHIPTSMNNNFIHTENTTEGLVTFNVTELNSAHDEMHIFDGIIVMFSVLSKASFNEAKITLAYLKDCYPNLLIVLCGNQVDRLAQHNRAVTMTAIRRTNFIVHRNYFDISARTYYHAEKPFLCLIRRLTNNNNARIIEQDAIEPPIMHFNDLVEIF